MDQDVKFQSQADRPGSGGEVQYHIRCRRGDVARYVLLPGDPDRVPAIAEAWDEGKKIAGYREHVTYTGSIDGIGVSACSTGAGGGSTASALEELAEIGADTFIRVGTCGAIQEQIRPGDLIICTGAVRHDGTSEQYVEVHYPALAHYEVVTALVEAAEKLEVPYHLGLSYTSASFFCGQGRPGFRGYKQSWMKNITEDMQKAGVMNYEMESATVFTLSQLFGLRAGAVFSVVASRTSNRLEYKKTGIDASIAVSNEALRILHRWDVLKEKKGKKQFFPSLLEERG